ncbi:putative sporulation protein YtxC [Thermobrachium celere]|uniref:Sporulation protein YtxC n=1 Tax=Thermobrachium celere DSM 8682 TaxID=941824 RepID=R7RT80_9CLOT|nr:putative sporulation protein YtxC [Thermobrachium celere]GFR36696.1 sporulation protein [Thermobrachium celere]CDF58478.1 FIG01165827: hypothetical protein [Thermobrachium celere DSM 8682]
MILLSIGFSKDNREIYDRLSELCLYFKDKGVNIALYENKVSNMNYIKCVLKETERDIKIFDSFSEMFYVYVANLIYEYIVNQYESVIIEKILKNDYDFLSHEDAKLIKEKCVMALNGTGIFSADSVSFVINRKNTILKIIEEYLDENKELIIDGFITFRLRNFESDLKYIVEKITEEYIIEKEYSEFIKLLKYFVDVQESRYDVINVVIQRDGNYLIHDNKYNNITSEFFEDFGTEIKIDATIHDMLISALITYAPKNIIIHGIENSTSQETIETIKNIFCDRLTVCSGCELCTSTNNIILT